MLDVFLSCFLIPNTNRFYQNESAIQQPRQLAFKSSNIPFTQTIFTTPFHTNILHCDLLPHKIKEKIVMIIQIIIISNTL